MLYDLRSFGRRHPPAENNPRNVLLWNVKQVKLICTVSLPAAIFKRANDTYFLFVTPVFHLFEENTIVRPRVKSYPKSILRITDGDRLEQNSSTVSAEKLVKVTELNDQTFCAISVMRPHR